jgi:hypothetical protein
MMSSIYYQAAKALNFTGVKDAVLYQGANVDSQTFDGLAQTALMLGIRIFNAF